MGVWELYGAGVWVPAPGVHGEHRCAGVDFGKRGVWRELVFQAAKGCPGMGGTGAWAPRPWSIHTGPWLPIEAAGVRPSCGHPVGGGKGSLSGMPFGYLEPSARRTSERKFNDKSETNKTKAIICSV